MSAILRMTQRLQSGSALEWSDLSSLAVLSIASGALHVSAAQGHWGESHLYGSAFIGLSIFQFGWGLAILMSARTRSLLAFATFVNVATILIYIASRTWGLPVGPDLGHPESLGIPDVSATIDEVVSVLFTWMVLHRRRPLPERAYLCTLALAFGSFIVFTSIAHVS